MSDLDVNGFVLSQLPAQPARVLEIGCGSGDLALALSGAGYDVLAIDPEAPVGSIFRRVTIEELEDPGPFDAVVASRSLHHVSDLRAAVEKIAALAPRVILDEFAFDRFSRPTAEWYYGQLRAQVAAGRRASAPSSAEACWRRWYTEHEGLHGWREMSDELRRRFNEIHFEWRPYLYHYLQGFATESLEQGLIDARAIRAVGFRYVGERK